MKIKGKHIAITAGLSAVLALSPVVGTVSSVYAEGDGSAANARVADEINITMKYLDQNGEWASYTTGTVGGKLQAVDIPMNVPGEKLVGFEVTSGVAGDQGNPFATVDDLLSFQFQGDATVEAVYEDVAPEEPEQRYITVHFMDGDEEISTGAVLNGTSDWSGIVSPTKDGYTFAGWQFEGESTIYTDAELDGVVIAADASVTEINLYAQWDEVVPEDRYIDVNYWDGDQLLGTGAVLNGTNQWSGIVSPTKDGYTFAGWQFEGEDTVTSDLDKVVFAGDASVTEINLYAQWDEVVPEDRYITVNYWDGDQLLGTGAVLNGTNQWSGIVSPTKDGYTLAGWQFEGESTIYTDAELDGVVIAADASVTEINLYAQWDEVVDPETKFYTVTFDDCLANTENLTVGVEEGKTVLKPIDPACEGWKFVGWFTDTALTQAYDFDAPVTADITLYAKWSQVEGAGEAEGAVTPTKPEDKGGLPQTGDIAAIATAAVAVAGAGIAGAGALINKRRK